MIASSRGLEVLMGDSRRLFAWHELAEPKDYPFAATTRLALRSGEEILYAYDNMRNIGIVKSMILEHRAESA